MIAEGTPEEEWKKLKWSKFSASEIDNLMTPGKGTSFSAGGVSYIERISREAYTLFNDDENNESFLMKRGKMKEPEAFQFYTSMIGMPDVLEYFGGSNPYFEQYCPDSGSSPDAIAWKDRDNKVVSWGIELKCPSSKVHFDYLRGIKTQFDLKEMNPLYYGQVQFNMMTFKADLWHWCSYNEYYPVRTRMKIVEIAADKTYQSNLKVRIKMAVKMKYDLLAQMRGLE